VKTVYPSFGFVGPDNLGLLVDLYELVMADAYLREGMNDEATFDLFVRSLPPHRAFLVSAGLESALHYLEHFRVDGNGIAYLRTLGLFSEEFLGYLRSFRFSGEVWAIPEGAVCFPPEPLLEVTAPRIEAQLVETFLLNTLNYQTMVASKAARVVLAAQGRSVVDFSPRRDHAADAAMKTARASYIAGCAGTSNVLAGKEYGIPVFGTMAHSYVMSFPDELSAFRSFARDFPQNAVLLIDTYDTVQGAHHAVTVGREMRERGHRLRGVRLDSGDLAHLSREVRAIFDAAGLTDVQILLSGDLDEYRIAGVLAEGAAADSFGVGTALGTSEDAPTMGGVYKLVEDRGGPKIKLSTGKATLPGRKQVWRRAQDGRIADVIGLRDEREPRDHAPLLHQVMAGGRVVRPEPLGAMRARCAQNLALLPGEFKDLHTAPEPPVTLSPTLEGLRAHMFERNETRRRP
jgi:nicotinate phosphoribosyltransferase